MRRSRSAALARRMLGLAFLLAVLAAGFLSLTSQAQSDGLGITIAVDENSLALGEIATLTGEITNPPATGAPAYKWEVCTEGTCISSPAHPLRFAWDRPGSWTFQLTVSYDSGESATSNQVSVAWAEASDAEQTAPEPETAPEPASEPETPTTPTVTGVAVTSDAGDDDTYGPKDVIEVTLTFSEAVTVTGTPRLKVDMDPADWGEKWAAYRSGSGTTALTFTHTVVEPNISTQGIALLTDTLELNGGTIRVGTTDAVLSHDGLAHNAEHKVDWQQSPPASTPDPEPAPLPDPSPPPAVSPTPSTPTVSGVSVSSDAGDDDTYGISEVIEVTLTFSEAVTVTGRPRLKIDMDPADWGEKWAAYASGSGTTALTFTHTVVEPNISTQGIAVLGDTLELNGGGIQSASSVDADLAHAGLAHDAEHKVDWRQTRPNRAPVVNTEAKNHAVFTSIGNAPRGTLVHKPYYGIFSDPDGDDLTYSVSLRAEHRSLVDELTISRHEERHAQLGHESWWRWEEGDLDLVFFEVEGDEDWKAISPSLADPLMLTFTLTATDSGGLSASVDGKFQVDWASHPEIESAVASAQAVVLTFDTALQSNPAPTADQFTVNIVNADSSTGTIAVHGVSAAGKAVTLSLASEPTEDQTVTVAYAHDADTPLQRLGGGDHAPNFAAQAVMAQPASLRLTQSLDDEGNLRPRTMSADWDPVAGAASYRLTWQRVGTSNAGSAQSLAGRLGGGQARAASGGGASDPGGPTGNQLTVPGGRTSAEFTLPDDEDYQVALQALDGDRNVIAQANNNMADPDTTPPRLVRGEIDGDVVTLIYSELLDENSMSGAFRMSLYSGGQSSGFTVEPRTVTVSGNKVVLHGLDDRGWLRIGTASEDRAALYYYIWSGDSDPQAPYSTHSRPVRSLSGIASANSAPDSIKALHDLAGNRVQTPHMSRLADGTIWRTDYTHLTNVTEPAALERAEAHPMWLSLTFDETLSTSSVPSASAFTVNVNGSRVSLAASDPVAVSENTVTLILAAALGSTDTVTVSYAKPSSNRLRGVDGDAAAFSNQTVTNRVGAIPSLSQTAITSTPAGSSIYGSGETIQISLTFTEAMTVDTSGGTPRLKIQLDPHQGHKWASYASGSGATTLVFAYTVAEPDRSPQGVAILRDALELNGGVIQSVADQDDAHRFYPGLGHNANHMVDWRRAGPGVPWVNGLAISSDPGDDETYARGDTIEVTVTYSEAVAVDTTGGTPRLKIRTARNDLHWLPQGIEKWLNYSGGGGTTELTFSYVVEEGLVSTRGIAVLGNTLSLNGGTIRSTDSTPVNAHLRHQTLWHDQHHRVDGRIPPLLGVVANERTVSVSFNELLDASSVPALSAFTVKRTPENGSEQTVALSGAADIRGGSVILTLSDALAASDTDVKVSYARPSSGASLKDLAGNPAASFTDQAVDAADTTPPRLERGEIDGDVLTIFYSEPLNENSVSTGMGKGDHFRINLHYWNYWPQDGQCPHANITFTTKPREVIVRGNAVTVVGTGPYEKNRSTVDWTLTNFVYVADVYVSERLRDLAGHPVSLRDNSGSKFWWSRIINLDNVTVLPNPISATVNGTRLTMTFSAPLNGGYTPAASAFTVKVNGSAASLAGSNPVSVSGTTVTLTLASGVSAGATVTVDYAKPHSSSALRNFVCEEAPSFTGEAVTNSTP